MLHNRVFLFVVVIMTASVANAHKPPKGFVLCHRADPDFEKCLGRAASSSIKSIASGNKELGLPVLDNLKVASIIIEGNGGPNDLSQHYTDCVISGPTSSDFPYMEASFKKNNCYFRMKTFTQALTIACQYAFKGKLMLFHVNGHGPSNITLMNMNAWHNMTCNIYDKGGNEYLNITHWIEDYDAENIFYDFHNLIDGNAKTSAQVLEALNNNALEVYESLKVDYEKSFAVIYQQLTNKVFNKIPLAEIFPE